MKKTAKILVFVFFSIVLLALAAATLWLYFENEKLHALVEEQHGKLNAASGMLAKANESISLLDSSLRQKEEELHSTAAQLNSALLELNDTRQELAGLENELSLTKEELNTTKNLLNITRTEFALLEAEVADLQSSINESIQWFRENSFLPGSADWFAYRVQNKCIKNKKLRLACISYLMGQKLGFSYIMETGDRLFSIDEMLSRRGGDCEDFSLFSKAVLNTLKANGEDAVVEAWAGGDGRYIVYEEKEGTTITQWYVDGEGVVLTGLDDVAPYVVCFAVDAHSGHCIVALSEKNITSVDGLDGLDGASLFEPQNGMHMGAIGKDLMLCRSGISDCERRSGHISFVISDDDLYQFKEGEWRSYDAYMQKAARIEQILASASSFGFGSQ